MTSENFENAFAAFQSFKPFRVFSIELHGGRRLEVDHPDALIIRDGIAVFFAPGGVRVLFDHDSVSQIIGATASTDW